jgi:hypothetical protein
LSSAFEIFLKMVMAIASLQNIGEGEAEDADDGSSTWKC